jgi:hypothetical protein
MLDTESVSNFTNGVYLVWTISGSVTFEIATANPHNNAVVSGIFFG